jgi:hypothetical protein
MNQLNQRQLQQHATLLGWLLIVEHAILLLVGAFVFVLLTSVGLVSRDSEAMTILGIVGTSVGMFLAALSVPGIAAGLGLLKRKSWGRFLAMVVGVLGMLNVPLGTLIGIYALWVLMQNSAAEYFGGYTMTAQPA